MDIERKLHFVIRFCSTKKHKSEQRVGLSTYKSILQFIEKDTKGSEKYVRNLLEGKKDATDLKKKDQRKHKKPDSSTGR